MIFLKDTDYAYAVAYIKALECKMLSSKDFDALADCGTTDAAFDFLHGKGYKEFGSCEISEALKNEYNLAFKETAGSVPKNSPMDILLYPNDFHNLKAVFEALLTDTDPYSLILTPYLTEPSEFEKAFKSADFSSLPSFIRSTAEEAYKILLQTADSRRAEILIDKSALLTMKKRAEQEKNAFISDWVEMNILHADIQIALRSAGAVGSPTADALIESALIPTEPLAAAAADGRAAVIKVLRDFDLSKYASKAEISYVELENFFEKEKLSLAARGSIGSFGIEPILAFLIKKKAEIRRIGIILFCIQGKLPHEFITERPGDFYA